MRSHNLYRVTTMTGGSIEKLVSVDIRYDSNEERMHRAWCTIMDDKRSAHYRMLQGLIKQMGVDKVKVQFCAALCFEKVV